MVAPSSPNVLLAFLVQLFLVLLLARALGRAADRLGFTPVVGELLTGFVLGPSAFGAAFPSAQRAVFRTGEALDVVASLGLVFLLFAAGTDTDFRLIRARGRTVVAAGVLGMLLPFALGAGLGLWLPPALVPPAADAATVSLFLGIALSISAIPVVVRVLVDLDALALPIAQVTVATAMFTDTVGWLALSLVVGVARGGGLEATPVLRTAGALVALFAAAFAVGPRFVDAAFARLGGATGVSGTAAVAALVAVGSSAASLAIGLEPAIGAFVAGLVVSRADVLDDAGLDALESVTLGVFAPVFFGVAGLRADLGLLLDPAVAAVGTATLVVAVGGKFAGVYVGATATGCSRAEAAVLGSGLNARGAVEIAVATVGLQFGILGPELYTVVVGVAVLTSSMAPPLLRLTLRRLPGDSGTGCVA